MSSTKKNHYLPFLTETKDKFKIIINTFLDVSVKKVASDAQKINEKIHSENELRPHCCSRQRGEARRRGALPDSPHAAAKT